MLVPYCGDCYLHEAMAAIALDDKKSTMFRAFISLPAVWVIGYLALSDVSDRNVVSGLVFLAGLAWLALAGMVAFKHPGAPSGRGKHLGARCTTSAASPSISIHPSVVNRPSVLTITISNDAVGNVWGVAISSLSALSATEEVNPAGLSEAEQFAVGYIRSLVGFVTDLQTGGAGTGVGDTGKPPMVPESSEDPQWISRVTENAKREFGEKSDLCTAVNHIAHYAEAHRLQPIFYDPELSSKRAEARNQIIQGLSTLRNSEKQRLLKFLVRECPATLRVFGPPLESVGCAVILALLAATLAIVAI